MRMSYCHCISFSTFLLLLVSTTLTASSLYAQDSGTLTKEEKEQIEKRKQARIRTRSLLSWDRIRTLDQTLVGILRDSSEDADASRAIRGALESGADPNKIFSESTIEYSAQYLSILLEYGADLKKISEIEEYFLNDMFFHSPILDSIYTGVPRPFPVTFLISAARESVKKNDLKPLKEMVAVLKKHGILDLKFKVIFPDAERSRRQCTIPGIMWEMYATAKKTEHEELCNYYEQVKSNNLQFLKTLSENLLTFDLTEKFENVSKEWSKTRKPIADHRKFWGASIRRSNFYGSMAMALDPEHKSKCEDVK